MNEAVYFPAAPSKKGRLYLARRAARLRKSLAAHYGRGLCRASRSEESGAEAIFIESFYNVEKTAIGVLKELDTNERPKLYCLPSGKPRILAAAEELFSLPPDREGTQKALGIMITKARITHAELRFLPVAVSIAGLSELDSLLSSASPAEAAVKRVILSLSAFGELPWEDIESEASPVESVLRSDGRFHELERASRNYCAMRAVSIAESLGIDEKLVSRTAAELARASEEPRKRSAAYYLAADGEEELRLALKGEAPKLPKTPKAMLTLFIAAFLAGAFGLSALFLGRGITMAALTLFPSALVSLSAVSTVFSLFLRPRSVPRLEVKNAEGELRTAVAVPVLLSDIKAAKEACGSLEAHYLADPLKGAFYILLADLPDSGTETTDEDAEKTEAARTGIGALNAEYGERFYLALRKRKKNKDGVWQGHERKRGAVTELARMLDGGPNGFLKCFPSRPPTAKYLAVLDSDTVLPPGALKKLIGAAAHPANSPVFRKGRPVSGYSVFVPRMRTTARSAAASFFSRLFSGDTGYELYSAAVSDLHMDTYREGDFGGKGILNVHAFLRATEGKIPDNAVLSHDLLEGCLARAAYLGDVVLLDSEPKTLPKWWKRQERWIRGDWQLLPFIFGGRRRSVGAIGRAKMLRNLFTSLREPVTLFLFVLAAALRNTPLAAMTAFAFLYDPIKGFLMLAFSSLRERAAQDRWIRLVLRTAVELVTLPYAAFMSFRAIMQALVRTLFTHRRMLLWQTASSSEGEGGLDRVNVGFSAALAAFLVFMTAKHGLCPTALLGFVFSAACTVSLPIVGTIGRTPSDKRARVKDKAFVFRLFLRGYRYFDELVNEENNHLPPDNLQETPEKPASRVTSPTDIGMALTAFVSAYDLGVIDGEAFAARSYSMLASIEKLEKWKGLPFNWYDVGTLAVLPPRFVSSVDAGNLFASLVTAAEALRESGAKEAAALAGRLAEDMELSALFDGERKLFRIGWSKESGRLTDGCYDLYASEARILTFVSAAWGKTPAESFSRLARVMRDAPGGRTALSWSGTLFEYLLPLVFFETVPGSFQHETVLSAVRTQILKSAGGRPWGASESGFYAFDAALNYQYRAFGEPALALDPARKKPEVTAPYAAALALYAEPEEAVRDLKNIVKLGAFGKYGLCEAIDFSSGGGYRIVRSYMAHHKGMELAAYAALLSGNRLAKRFMSIPRARAFEQLLFEEMPLKPIVIRDYETPVSRGPVGGSERIPPERTADPDSLDGVTLVNGRGFLHVFSDGSSLSGSEGAVLTDEDGVRLFIAGRTAREVCGEPRFTPSSACFSLVHEGVRAELTVFMAALKDARIRELVLVNDDKREKNFRIGAFFRPVGAEEREFAAHPAFFRQTVDARLEDGTAVFRVRKKRGRPERFIYAALLSETGAELSSDGCIRPGRLVPYTEVLKTGACFSERPAEPLFGAVSETELPPSEAKSFVLITGSAKSFAEAFSSAAELKRTYSAEKQLASAVTEGVLRGIGAKASLPLSSGPLISRILRLAPHKEIPFTRPKHGVRTLWELGISGDRPIICVKADRADQLPFLGGLAGTAKLCSAAGIGADFCIVSGLSTDYGDPARRKLQDIFAGCPNAFIFDSVNVTREQTDALFAMALISVAAERIPFGAEPTARENNALVLKPDPVKPAKLEFRNGIGGFDMEREEYAIDMSEGTPAPWSNVLANGSFGSVVTANGGGYTFAENSRLMRITPFFCDPLLDPPGETLVLSENGFTLPLMPYGGKGGYTVTHGLGYTASSCSAAGLSIRFTQFADSEKPLKYLLVEAENTRSYDRKTELSLRVRWAVGEYPDPASLILSFEEGVLFADSARRPDDGRSAFAAGAEAYRDGAAVRRFTVPKEGRAEAVFVIGMCGRNKAREYGKTAVIPGNARAELEKVRIGAIKRLGGLRVSTGDAGFDMLVNRLLLHQCITSRLTAKTGYYQSGGAVGFRDRLQDACALLLTEPPTALGIIADSAAHQFREGDVLHWWHGKGLGVRTRISDDRLFLPFACLEYARITGDASVWDGEAPYLAGEPLSECEHDRYAEFLPGDESESIFGHCIRAIRLSMRLGQNGIPLMGTGDWNDGFDAIGGESCVNGWMLLYLIERFVPLMDARGEKEAAREFEAFARTLRESMERTWEGDRYLRAIGKKGEKLGSKTSRSCAFDLVSAVWAVFAGAEHAEEGFMNSVRALLDESGSVLRLLSPPFAAEDAETVGYIGSYKEGVRENGGQYSHAAAWAVIAACRLKKPSLAKKLFGLADPIARSDRLGVMKYRTEPYAAAGDICGFGENAGQGGWTLYTGAAGWLYRAAAEHILGIKKTGDLLKIEPVTETDRFEFDYRFGSSLWHIRAERGDKGETGNTVKLVDDGREHEAEVRYK